MDLTLTEEQEWIRQSVRSFLARECPMRLVREMAEHPLGYSPDLWKVFAEMGCLGLPFSEDYGGMGGGFLDLCLVIEELGRFRFPGPFVSTAVLCGLPIARFGGDAQKTRYLPQIANGEMTMAYAQTEPDGSWSAGTIQLAAQPRDGGFLLNGRKLFVAYAGAADALLVATRTSAPVRPDGITLFLVDASASGVSRQPLPTIDFDHQHEVVFENVWTPRESVLGGVGEGAPIVEAINQWGAAARCAEMVGGAERVLEMSIDYAKTRNQFDRPIGAFQAVQHRCADMAVDVISSRFIAYEAIWRLSEGLEASKEVSMAKAWVGDAYGRICASGHQIHGAIGFTHEHDMHLYFRHARAAELAFGDGDYHRARLCRRLGL